MSTLIAKISGTTEIDGESILTIRRFSGGKERGSMLYLNISTRQRYAEIEISEEQVKSLIPILIDAFDRSIYKSK